MWRLLSPTPTRNWSVCSRNWSVCSIRVPTGISCGRRSGRPESYVALRAPRLLRPAAFGHRTSARRMRRTPLRTRSRMGRPRRRFGTTSTGPRPDRRSRKTWLSRSLDGFSPRSRLLPASRSGPTGSTSRTPASASPAPMLPTSSTAPMRT